MLEPLDDLHVWVQASGAFVPLQQRERPQNASWNGSKVLIGGFRSQTRGIVGGRTKDDLGYVNVQTLSSEEVGAAFDAFLEELADTRGLVLDLRWNGGGDERLARRIAGRFLAEPLVYATHQFRDGPEHDAFGPVSERVCEPRGPWRYEAPVVVLFGQRTMSSAEALALMFAAAPGVTTMGDRTAGSSGNPRTLELRGGIRVNLPRWRAMTPELVPIEHAGVAPDVAVPARPEAFTATFDPVLARALEHLRGAVGEQR